MREFNTDRRRLLKTTGATIAASFLAGCGGGGNGGDDGDGDDSGNGGGDRTPKQIAMDYVSGDTAEHQGAANFDGEGSIVDETGSSSVTIANGEKPGTRFVFDPVVVTVDSGTEVTWNWVSGGHSVSPIDDKGATITGWEGLGGATGVGQGKQHTVTFDSSGVALYYCEPHFGQGQSGAVIVK